MNSPPTSTSIGSRRTHVVDQRLDLGSCAILGLHNWSFGFLDFLRLGSLERGGESDWLSNDGLFFGDRFGHRERCRFSGNGCGFRCGSGLDDRFGSYDGVGRRIDKGIRYRLGGCWRSNRYRGFSVDRSDRSRGDGRCRAGFRGEVASKVGLGDVVDIVEEGHCECS